VRGTRRRQKESTINLDNGLKPSQERLFVPADYALNVTSFLFLFSFLRFCLFTDNRFLLALGHYFPSILFFVVQNCLVHRVSEMGGDGQALANKRSLLQKFRVYVTSAQLEEGDLKEKQTAKSRSVERWRYCALSLDPLELPAAFDTKGNVLSKQSVVDYLFRKKEESANGETDEDRASYLKKLSDVRDISNEVDDADEICCPVTGFVASSGVHAFVGFWGCGHVVCSSTLPKWANLASQVDVECPFCGQRSFYVRLVLDNEDDAERQLVFLRPYLKKHRKRGRDE
jgi:hypothetical protein